jgi:vesicle-associated membrane protein 4
MDSNYELFLKSNDLPWLKGKGEGLLQKFNAPESFDRLHAAQNNVNQIKGEVQNNVNTLVARQEDINTLEEQTNEMRENAGAFEKNAKELERELFWRKVKYTAVIVLVVIAIALIIGLSVGLTTRN